MEDLKLPPYQRLKNILTEEENPHLTDKASKNLDELLGVKPKEPNMIDKIISFFKKIDSKIFAAKSRKWNTTYHKH